MANKDHHEAVFLARMRLEDPSREVVETAINTLGTLQARDTVNNLVDIFYAEPDLRTIVIQALAKMGGDDAEKLLMGATNLFFGKNLDMISMVFISVKKKMPPVMDSSNPTRG